MTCFRLIITCAMLGACGITASAQDSTGIDPEALIDRVLAVDRQQSELLNDVTYSAEYVEREDKGDEGVKEKVRLIKEVYVKYYEDTAWFAEKYLEYYKEGEIQSEDELRKQSRERTEKRIKRRAHDVSYPMLRPFYPSHRSLYTVEYRGLAEGRIDDRICHCFRVDAKEPEDSLINGDFYFEAETFHLARVDFSPSKLVKKLMFKLNELNMTLQYAPTDEGYWLPRQFDIQGKGKAALFIGVSFAGTEYYRNPIVNSGLDDSIFEVSDD